jgi:hypothetical protein
VSTAIIEKTAHASSPNPVELLQRAMLESEFLKAVIGARTAGAESRAFRPLSATELQTLKEQHNAAEDWARVLVKPGFNPHKVVGCFFSGDVQLGIFREKVCPEPGVLIGSGVYNCDLVNVSVGDDAYLCNNDLIANYIIGPGVIIRGCGSVVCTGTTSFGNGQQVSLGLETGGRDTGLYAEITVEVAARIAARRTDRKMLNDYTEAIEEYRRAATFNRGMVQAGASIKSTPKVLNTWIGPAATIDSAVWIENSTILSSPDEPTRIASGACVKSSIVQWGARIETHGQVENSVCCEHSFVDSQGQLVKSLLGPNSGVAAGEVRSSLVGPFVGFNHQALLIAAYWPEGKGTIGYGANVGSNHTGKAPDQEIWPGEGVLFGMGVSIKFPADFSKAAYSIIASGLATLPQRIEMPFSLINQRAESFEGISPAYNEILPGWVLSDNIYTVRRNERKFATRNKAIRERCDFEVFRPEIVDLMVRARAALKKGDNEQTPARIAAQKASTPGNVHRPIFTDKDIPGLGKNFMKETARLEGIEAYTFYIRFYALKGLYFAVRFCLEHDRDVGRVMERGIIGDPRYDHELSLLESEFPGKGVRELLPELIAAYEKMAADTLLSKEKDNFRGIRIIPDYAGVHLPAKEDTFVRATIQETAEIKEAIERILSKI